MCDWDKGGKKLDFYNLHDTLHFKHNKLLIRNMNMLNNKHTCITNKCPSKKNNKLDHHPSTCKVLDLKLKSYIHHYFCFTMFLCN